MSKNLLVAILVLVCFYSAGNALKCSICLGTKTSDCHSGKASSIIIQNCSILPNYLSWLISLVPNTNDDQNDIVPTCIQTVLKTPFYNTDGFARNCVLVPKGIDACKVLANLTQVENCKTCLTDNCNNTPIL